MYFVMVVNICKKKMMFVDMMFMKENDKLEIIDHIMVKQSVACKILQIIWVWNA